MNPSEIISYPHRELIRTPADLSQFFVITVISNPIRYKRRYELYWRFKEMCEHAGVKLITVEQAFGNRRFMVTRPGDPYNLQIRTVEELWHKENMINLGIKHASAQWPGQVREVAWIDADCVPARPARDWFEETWHELQHYEFVQMWETIIDLDHSFNPIGKPGPSFMSNYVKYGTPYPMGSGTNTGQYPYTANAQQWGSPGLAWAANIDAVNKIGMLPDYPILGAGDWYLAHMLISALDLKGMNEYSPGYQMKFQRQQELCERWIKRDVGYVKGFVMHYWHGRKADRRYNSREQILIECEYDPYVDVKYDSQGLLQLETWEPRQIKMRDRLRDYFRSRNEDSIDL